MDDKAALAAYYADKARRDYVERQRRTRAVVSTNWMK